MSKLVNRSLAAVFTLAMPLCCYGLGQIREHHFSATLIATFNVILLITSVICIVQFFFSHTDHRKFHIMNLVFAIVFYWIAISFLLYHRSYYPGFEHLTTWQCIRKLFFTLNPFVLKHWIIAFACVLNIIYTTTNRGELLTTED